MQSPMNSSPVEELQLLLSSTFVFMLYTLLHYSFVIFLNQLTNFQKMAGARLIVIHRTIKAITANKCADKSGMQPNVPQRDQCFSTVLTLQ